MKNTFAIGIPTLNRYDLLKEALDRYIVDFPTTHIYIVDNGNQGIDDSNPNITVLKSSYNLGVAASWNVLCNTIFEEYTHALIMNDDIIIGKTESEIYELLNTVTADFYVGPFYWSVFIIFKDIFDKVGGFDEEFYPAYLEDNDYHYRMKLMNCKYIQIEELLPEVCRNSMTLEKEPTINSTFEKLMKFYKEKWGGKPGEEKYLTPFNKNIQ
jgi:GT2 family glycosyltransferase